MRTPTVRTLMPLWWSWHGNGGATRAVYAGAVSVRRDPGMGTTTALMPLCAAYHRGEQLDTSWPFQCVPFSAQRTDAGSELHVLWRAFFMRAQPGSTVVQVGPLWWSQTRSGASLRWSVLGGLVRQTCNYTKGTARVRVLWFFPVSGETHFQPESAHVVADRAARAIVGAPWVSRASATCAAADQGRRTQVSTRNSGNSRAEWSSALQRGPRPARRWETSSVAAPPPQASRRRRR